MNNKMDIVYKKVIEVLKLVASPADVQLKAFPDYVCKPDEVALTFDEIVSYTYILLSNSIISKTQYEELNKINCYFDTFSKTDWSEDAMYDSEKWNYSRKMATDVLKLFNCIYTPPKLFWIDFVQND